MDDATTAARKATHCGADEPAVDVETVEKPREASSAPAATRPVQLEEADGGDLEDELLGALSSLTVASGAATKGDAEKVARGVDEEMGQAAAKVADAADTYQAGDAIKGQDGAGSGGGRPPKPSTSGLSAAWVVEWSEKRSRWYYFDKKHGKALWHRPEPVPVPAPAQAPAPAPAPM